MWQTGSCAVSAAVNCLISAMATVGEGREPDVKRLFGGRVRAFRAKLAISQQELADRAHVDRTYEVNAGALMAGLPAPGQRRT